MFSSQKNAATSGDSLYSIRGFEICVFSPSLGSRRQKIIRFGIFSVFCYNVRMKRALVVSLALLSASSFASFELGIITDSATGFHRFDLETGIYLGAFGAGLSGGVLSTWADQRTSTFYSMNNNGIRKWNYSTGEYLGVVNFGASFNYATHDLNGNFYTVNGTNTITVYNLDGTDTTITAPLELRPDGCFFKKGD